MIYLKFVFIEKTGKSYNIFDKINNVWNKCSFWTHSNDVSYDDGQTASVKNGAINGITSDLAGEDESMAVSATAVSQLNRNLGGLRFGMDGDGNYGYYGADGSLIPFKSGTSAENIVVNDFTPTEDCDAIIIMYSWACNLQDEGVWTQVFNYFREDGVNILDNSHTKSRRGKSDVYKIATYKLKKGVTYTSSISQNPNSWTEASGSFASGVNFIIY